MRELEYPFDPDWIIKNKRSIKKELLKAKNSFVSKKIAVLGGSTTRNIVEIIDLFLLNQGISGIFYQSDFGRYYEEAMFENNALKDFDPDIIYICTSNRNIQLIPDLNDSIELIDSKLDQEYGKFSMMWDHLFSEYGCPIIQNNIEMPFYRTLGNKESSDYHGLINYYSRFNLNMYEYAREHDDFFVCDINYISADFGLKEWSDPFYWYMYKMPLCSRAIPYLALNVSNIIKSILGKNKKGFVIDLDNTLWGGVIGECGLDGISLASDTPSGEAYIEFQRYIQKIKELGILLNIDSKNEYDNALLGLNHPNSLLKPDDFIEIKANWNDKDENFIEIAKSLNVLPESLVFVDDNPVERLLVSSKFENVCVPEIGEVHHYISNLDRNGFFETTYFSCDDKQRSRLYKDEHNRKEYSFTFSNQAEFLEALEMKAIIKPFDSFYYMRIVQLINKTNQFNLTAKKYTKSEIEYIACSSDYISLYGVLKDKFGDNGLVSVCIGKIVDSICYVEEFLLSCRVFKRGMEFAVFDRLVDECIKLKIDKIIGLYNPTGKNTLVSEFYVNLGFEQIDDNENYKQFLYSLSDSYTKRNLYIEIEV